MSGRNDTNAGGGAERLTVEDVDVEMSHGAGSQVRAARGQLFLTIPTPSPCRYPPRIDVCHKLFPVIMHTVFRQKQNTKWKYCKEILSYINSIHTVEITIVQSKYPV